MSVQYNKDNPIPTPPMIWENIGFWEGIKNNELVFQRCKECRNWVHPPRPTCPKCRSLEKDWSPSKGRGTIRSWITYKESPHPGFKAPYSVVLVELEEGVRMISNMVDASPDEIAIGTQVEVVFDDLSGEVTLPKFRKVG